MQALAVASSRHLPDGIRSFHAFAVFLPQAAVNRVYQSLVNYLDGGRFSRWLLGYWFGDMDCPCSGERDYDQLSRRWYPRRFWLSSLSGGFLGMIIFCQRDELTVTTGFSGGNCGDNFNTADKIAEGRPKSDLALKLFKNDYPSLMDTLQSWLEESRIENGGGSTNLIPRRESITFYHH